MRDGDWQHGNLQHQLIHVYTENDAQKRKRETSLFDAKMGDWFDATEDV